VWTVYKWNQTRIGVARDRQTACLWIIKGVFENQSIYLQQNTEFIDRYKSKWKAKHVFFKNPAEGPQPQHFYQLK